MREDAKGLYVEAKISNTALGNEVLELMRDGVIDQMSIGYSVPQGKAEYKDGVRYIKELKLYEFSAVTFPMNEAARITGLKTQITEAIKAGEMDKEIVQHLIAELKALLDTQPPASTEPLVKQPPELEGLKGLLLNFGSK
jgi:phage head maturation protease